MSLATWKEEFYGSMEEAVKSDRTAIEHSLQKWIGLRKENLARHHLVGKGYSGLETESGEAVNFSIDDSTCSLCLRNQDTDTPCPTCPLKKTLGYTCDAGGDSLFHSWLQNCNPEPMIRALRKTLAQQGRGRGKK